MKMKSGFVAVLLVLCIAHAHAAEKMRVAVLDLQARGINSILAGGVSSLIRSDMVDAGVFTVIERGQMKEILKEQGLQQTGCTDSSCAVEVGKLLSARKILIGEVTKMGSSALITVRIVDVEKGVAEFSSSEKAKDMDSIDAAAHNLSRKLVLRITGKSVAELYSERKPRTRSGYYMRSLVPGWGQVYAGRKRGYVYLGLFTLSAALSAYTIYDYSQKKSDYESVPAGSPRADFNSAFDDYEQAGTVALAAVCLTGAVYLVHWVDAAFLTGPSFSRSLAAGSARSGSAFLVLQGGISSCEYTERRTRIGAGIHF